MKRLFSILAITGLMTFANVQAQDSAPTTETEQVADTTATTTEAAPAEAAPAK